MIRRVLPYIMSTIGAAAIILQVNHLEQSRQYLEANKRVLTAVKEYREAIGRGDDTSTKYNVLVVAVDNALRKREDVVSAYRLSPLTRLFVIEPPRPELLIQLKENAEKLEIGVPLESTNFEVINDLNHHLQLRDRTIRDLVNTRIPGYFIPLESTLSPDEIIRRAEEYRSPAGYRFVPYFERGTFKGFSVVQTAEGQGTTFLNPKAEAKALASSTFE